MMINRKFIKELEGGQKTLGYVPKGPGKSGTTIASGVDIGQMIPPEIYSLKISLELKNKLIPYTNLRGQLAKEYLHINPLRISKEEANLLDDAIFSRNLSTMQYYWDNTSKIKWENLTESQRTVVMSVAHHHGLNLVRVCPKFWKNVTQGDWPGVDFELRNFYNVDSKEHKFFGPRRVREANYLKESLCNT